VPACLQLLSLLTVDGFTFESAVQSCTVSNRGPDTPHPPNSDMGKASYRSCKRDRRTLLQVRRMAQLEDAIAIARHSQVALKGQLCTSFLAVDGCLLLPVVLNWSCTRRGSDSSRGTQLDEPATICGDAGIFHCAPLRSRCCSSVQLGSAAMCVLIAPLSPFCHASMGWVSFIQSSLQRKPTVSFPAS
jgi:hypothetical protein